MPLYAEGCPCGVTCAIDWRLAAVAAFLLGVAVTFAFVRLACDTCPVRKEG